MELWKLSKAKRWSVIKNRFARQITEIRILDQSLRKILTNKKKLLHYDSG